MSCTRPHQTGMEKQWEEWVLATLNFLHRQDIPFYKTDGQGARVGGKDLEIPKRLRLLEERIASDQRVAMRRAQDLINERADHRSTKDKLAEAHLMLGRVFLTWMHGNDGMESAAVMEDLELYVEKHLPHLVEEEADA